MEKLEGSSHLPPEHLSLTYPFPPRPTPGDPRLHSGNCRKMSRAKQSLRPQVSGVLGVCVSLCLGGEVQKRVQRANFQGPLRFRLPDEAAQRLQTAVVMQVVAGPRTQGQRCRDEGSTGLCVCLCMWFRRETCSTKNEPQPPTTTIRAGNVLEK